MNDTTPRKTAKALGLTRYEGRACLHGHGTTRNVASGDCVTCRNIDKAKAAMRKRILRGPVKLGRKRKYPIFVGPPKPKKNQQYDKTTDVGKWIFRSKNSNKGSARKTLTVDDYKKLVVTHCPLLGMELTYINCAGNHTPQNYATLDRIDSTKGYVVGNVQIISFRANTIKGDATLEELKRIAQNWETTSKK